MKGSQSCRVILVALVRCSLLTLGVVSVLASLSIEASANSCPNEQIRKQEALASQLPDCRAYEQVSPVNKNTTDAQGRPYLVQSSPSGSGVVYFSLLPFPELKVPRNFQLI